MGGLQSIRKTGEPASGFRSFLTSANSTSNTFSRLPQGGAESAPPCGRRLNSGSVPVMVQGYYTLEEAAQVLGVKPEELKAMAQRNEIRSFQDRGSWRFRIPDIQ